MRYILATLLVMLNLIACSEQRAPMQGEVSDHDLKKSTKIVGGEDVDPSDEHVEFVVMIMGKYETGEPYVCTGTLIDYDLVLTAAHCIGMKDTMQITFGESPVHDGPVQVNTVKETLKHDRFNKTEEIRNDIGLIQMNDAAPENFEPAILPWKSKKSIHRSKDFNVYGFGVTSGIVRDGKLNTKTVGVMRTTSLTADRESEKSDVFYAKQTQGKGICSGDSGGPAFMEKNILIGVISRGITDDPANPQAADNDICNYESVFTNVRYYQTWITEGIEKLHQAIEVPDAYPFLN